MKIQLKSFASCQTAPEWFNCNPTSQYHISSIFTKEIHTLPPPNSPFALILWNADTPRGRRSFSWCWACGVSHLSNNNNNNKEFKLNSILMILLYNTPTIMHRILILLKSYDDFEWRKTSIRSHIASTTTAANPQAATTASVTRAAVRMMCQTEIRNWNFICLYGPLWAHKFDHQYAILILIASACTIY